MKYPFLPVAVISSTLLGAVGVFQPVWGQGISLEKKVEVQNPFSATAEKPPEPKPFEASVLSLPPPPIPPLLSPVRAPATRKSGEASISKNSPPVAAAAPQGTQTEAPPAGIEPAPEPPRTELPCPIIIESGERYDVPSVGGQMIVRVSLVGDRSCVLAVESKVSWISVNAFDGKTLILDFQANTRRRDRSGAVVLANAQFSKNLQVYQSPCIDPNCEGALTAPVEPTIDPASKAPKSKGDSVESR